MRLVAISFIAAYLGAVTATPLVAADPLAVAKNLVDSKYKNWKYGSNPKENQVDCVQFLLAVVEESVGGNVTSKVRNRILIAELSDEEKKHPILGSLVVDGDKRTKGVQSALVEASLGRAISLKDVAPGDLIQYWMKQKDGVWFGHAGVIESVDRTESTPKVRIYGAHASPAPAGTIGTSPFELKLADSVEDRRIYLVRVR